MTVKKKEFTKGIRLREDSDALTQDGELRYDGTEVKAHADGSERSVVTSDQSQTITNKTIDSATNTVTIDADEATVENLEVDNLKAGVLDTDISSTSASHDTIPSAKATKDYVDSQILTKDEASEISYDNATSGLTATDVQAAVDEVEARVDTNETDIGNNTTGLSDHLADAADAHDASAISNVPSGNLAATDVQGALNELQGDIDTNTTGISDHLADAADAHDASAISNVPAGNLAATDVQGALNELQTDVDSRALASGLSDHLSDAVDAHDASAISNVPSGNLAATDVQGALNELQTDVDTRATDADLTSHTGATVAHGATGAVVGTTNTQTLTNKTIDSGSIQTPSRLDVKQDTRANLDVYAGTAADGQLVYATDEDKYYGVVSNELVALGGGLSSPSIFGSFNGDDDKVSDFTTSGGTLSEETTNPLNGDVSFKFAPSAASDETESPAVIITDRVEDKTTVMTEFVYRASDDGFRAEIRNSSNVVIASMDLPASETSVRLIYNVNSSDTSLNFAIVDDTHTASMNIIFDDIIFDDKTLKEIDTVEQEEYFAHDISGFASTNTRIVYYSNVDKNTTGSIVEVDNSSTLGMSITARTDCRVYINADSHWGGTGETFGITLNSSELTTNIQNITNEEDAVFLGSGVNVPAVVAIDLKKDDVLRPHAGNAYGTTGTSQKWNFRFHAVATNRNVVVDGDSRVNSISLEGNDGRAITASTEDIFWSGTGVGWTSGADGTPSTYTVQKDDSIVTIRGARYATVDNDDTLDLYVNGVAANRTLNNPSPTGRTQVTQFQYTSYKGEFSAGDTLSIRGPIGRTLNTTGGATIHYLNINEHYNDQAIIIPIADPYENVYSAAIDGSAAGSVSIISESTSFLDSSIGYTANGIYDLDFTKLGLTVNPAIVVTVKDDNGWFASVESVTTTTAQIRIISHLGTQGDRDFNIVLTRQGADYREPKGYFIGSMAQRVAYIKDVKSSGTGGGTNTGGGTWDTRDLNTVSGDSGFLTLSSNQFTLPEGTYDISASAPAHDVDGHQIRLRNITDSTTETTGTVTKATQTQNDQAISKLEDRIIITATKTFEIQNATSTAKAGAGFGDAQSFGDEVYTQVKITKVK